MYLCRVFGGHGEPGGRAKAVHPGRDIPEPQGSQEHTVTGGPVAIRESPVSMEIPHIGPWGERRRDPFIENSQVPPQ